MHMKTKQPKEETDTERGVSPVIGVILMVAITVILAAVIAAFVLDIGPGEPDPNAAVSVSGDEAELQSLDNADGIVLVNGTDGDTDEDKPIQTTSGGILDLEGASDDATIQAVRLQNGADDIEEGEIEWEDVEANAIVENLD